MLAPVYTTHADSVPSPMLWLYACINVLVTTPILCSKKLFVVSRQHETSSSGAYARSILCNQAQTAKEASREMISGVQATSVTKKSYFTTLVDITALSLHLPRPRTLWSSNRDDVARSPPPAPFNASCDLRRMHG